MKPWKTSRLLGTMCCSLSPSAFCSGHSLLFIFDEGLKMQFSTLEALEIYLSSDIIDVRDLMESIEELEIELHNSGENECFELTILMGIMSDLKDMGADEEWRGDWYPATLIRDSYFFNYAQDLAEDIGALKDAEWPHNCIDWEYAADELKNDYFSVEIIGSTYWTR